MKLTVERNERKLVERGLTAPGLTVLITPPLDEEWWLLRVPVSTRQAVVLFPKFMTYGIGFQHEEDWNTNLPSACPAETIYRHIRHNKGDKNIPRARCLAAIRLLQAEIVRLTGNPLFQPYRLPDGTDIPSWEAVDRGLLARRPA